MENIMEELENLFEKMFDSSEIEKFIKDKTLVGLTLAMLIEYIKSEANKMKKRMTEKGFDVQTADKFIVLGVRSGISAWYGMLKDEYAEEFRKIFERSMKEVNLLKDMNMN